MELRQPSREAIQLSQQLFASQKTKQTQHKPPPPNHLKLLHERASAKQVAVLPLALMGLRIPSLLPAACTHSAPTRSPAHAAPSAGRRGMACAGDPGQPLADPALAARESPGSVLQANSAPYYQLLILQ